jgi:hypothetical protein
LPALATLIVPNFYGVFSDKYTGPEDITQFYFYAGVLLLPLAIFGLRDRTLRWTGLLLAIPTIWYALGHWAGLYLLLARLPGFSSVRAPVNIWFVPALGLALLAGAGLAALADRWPLSWLPAAVLTIACADLFYFQSATNPLAYSRESYETLYGSKEQLFQRAVVAGLPPLTRLDGPEHVPVFGPMSHFFTQRTEVTYGYGPLPLARYKDYVDAIQANPKLRAGLNVSRLLDTQIGGVRAIPDALPRANFPSELVAVRSMAESKQRLATLDQSRQALAPPELLVPSQDGSGVAEVRQFSPGHYRIHYKCASPSLLRVGNAYFDGWTAKAAGQTLKVAPVDHALIGTVVPAGEGDVELDYRSTYFLPGGLTSLLSAMVCLGLLWRRSKIVSHE